MNIDMNLDSNIEYIETLFSDWGDIVKRKFPIAADTNLNAYIIYIDSMTDRISIEDGILNNFMIELRKVAPSLNSLSSDIYNSLKNSGLTTADFTETSDIDEAVDEVLTGNTAVFVDGFERAIIVSTKGFPQRSVSESDTETIIQGAKDAFNETMRVNTVLIRRRIRDTKLKLKQIKIGRRSKTDIGIMYLDDVVRKDILKEVEDRLALIDIDAILDSGYIEQFIEDDWLSPFPQVQLTERPDKAAAAILEGRIVIVVDNTPFVMIVPTVMVSFYQSSEDYFQRWEIMSFVRVIRFIAGILAMCLPGFYIATAVYHPSMIPMDLFFRMADARKTVPIPAVLEILLMEIAFETLREAGIRLPSAIGSTLGIVGGLIVGQAAVEAGLVSPIVVIVISLTGICSFAIPSISLVSGFRLSKYVIIFLSAILGLLGFWIGLLIILIHLSTLKSFGIPYLFPFASIVDDDYESLKDSVVRFPVFSLKKRTIFANPNQKTRLNYRKKRKKQV